MAQAAQGTVMTKDVLIMIATGMLMAFATEGVQYFLSYRAIQHQRFAGKLAGGDFGKRCALGKPEPIKN